MTEKPSPERQGDDRDEADRIAPMERFRSLARLLVTVSPEKVAEEQAKYDEAEERKRRPRLTPN